MRPEQCVFLWREPPLEIKCKGFDGDWWLWKSAWEMTVWSVAVLWVLILYCERLLHGAYKTTGRSFRFHKYSHVRNKKPFLCLKNNCCRHLRSNCASYLRESRVETWETGYYCIRQRKWDFTLISKNTAQLREYPSVFLHDVNLSLWLLILT